MASSLYTFYERLIGKGAPEKGQMRIMHLSIWELQIDIDEVEI